MKRLFRSETDRKIAGVVGGLAEYLNMDASLLRIITVLLFIFSTGVPVLLIYIVWVFLVPNEGDVDR
ncbi:PspC domain-containing protein [Bacillus paralicheniformis]|jgi:phage shock protein PspC (stress-responsive transcriptional regulator)|uniref:PspC domain-containing protein n=1 Tax=Bacillus paralicheniformis TaxID=1648923 RepID=A0A6I7TVL6_9BACI|nr:MULTISPECIES: PspC domain-containing protein [Bacillus]ETB71713.1 membrane protein [Bacillus sp. CPSM8]KJD55023.1 membrane protein [Bacillus amyloliquefaciens]KUL13865.1 membrane protein [Bacillus licheniformis LMG 7559]KUL17856.1 membrane protein [Bacillus licheniformis LMG 6934]MBC8621491.1 PspC domain-containing protein [Robertmurraya crescens]POO81385.1 PspC domain-containing protein [Bacillus sp. MBGLi97]